MINTIKIRALKLLDKIFLNLEKDKISFDTSLKNKIKNNIQDYSPDNFFKQLDSLCKFIENIYVLPDITYEKVQKMLETSLEKGYAGTLVPQAFTKYAKTLLNKKKSNHPIATCIDFPFGHSFFESKIEQAKILSYTDIDEVDIVMNITLLREKRYFYVYNELYDINNILKDKLTKVIIENSFLNFEQKMEATIISYIANYDFVCNTTNYGPHGIKLEDIILMKMIYGNRKVKAFGNINTREYAFELINHGASRIGLINPQKIF